MTGKASVRTIALSGLTSLESHAFRSILTSRYPDVEILAVSVDRTPDEADFHILSPESFFAHLQFYMPRKSHVAILFDSSSSKTANGEPVALCRTDDIATITQSLYAAIDMSETDEEEHLDLTPREKEVLCLIAQGATIKELACRLGISANTALTHRKNISAKLGIRSVSGLSLYAMINGLI